MTTLVGWTVVTAVVGLLHLIGYWLFDMPKKEGPKPFLLTKKDYTFDLQSLEGKSLNDVIAYFEKFREIHKDHSPYLDFYSDFDGGYIVSLYFIAPETPAEKKQRLQIVRNTDSHERQLYEKLKKKYEGT